VRLLYVAHNVSDPSKGAAHADLSLLSALRERGHDVEEYWDIGTPRAISHDNFHLLLEAPRKCEQVVTRQLMTAPFDVVVVNQPLGWRAARAVRVHRLAPLFVARSHGWEPRVFMEFRPFLGTDDRSQLRRIASGILRIFLHRQNRLLLRWVDGIVVPSRDDKEYLLSISGVSAKRVLAMPPGLPMVFLQSPALPLTADRCQRLLYVGQFALVKAPSVVAAIMTRVLESQAGASASWVCAARDHDRVRALLPDAVRNRVTLLDWMPREELLKVYDAHGIYVFPSFFEGFAQTFLEAMARGMAVLATRVDGMGQAIRDGENGFLFDPGRPVEMAIVAIKLMCGKVDVATLGREARMTAEGYTWSRSAEMFEDFVTSLAPIELRHG
jgi:glycosyltransferase involved in cell wall biosynthesis